MMRPPAGLIRLTLAMVLNAWALGVGEANGFVRLRAEPAVPGRPDDKPVVARMIARSVIGQLPSREIEVPVPGAAEITLEPGPWSFTNATTGWWAEDSVVEVLPGSTPTEVSVKLWRTGIVTAIVAAKGESIPARLAVDFEAAPGALRHRTSVPRGTRFCPIQSGRWTCELPEGDYDLRLRQVGFLPHYIWDTAIEAGAEKHLDPLSLVPGASISGFIQDDDGAAVPSCQVTLGTSDGRDVLAPRADQPQRGSPLVTASTNKRGFFQIGPIAPGAYSVYVDAQKGHGGGAAAVAVGDGAESRLGNALRLARPIAFEVAVKPPASPSGGSWYVTLTNVARFPAQTVQRIAASRDHGIARLRNLAAGPHFVHIEDDHGQTWFTESIQLEEGSGPIEIQLPLWTVVGTIRLGARPLAGQLTFENHQHGIKLNLVSDNDGVVRAVLPKLERWIVRVASSTPAVQRRIDVSLTPADGEAHFEIQLPDTKFAGQVLDEDRRPVGTALIMVRPIEANVTGHVTHLWSDIDGRFELRGLPEGPVLVQATSQDLEGTPVTFRVGGVSQDVQLLLQRKQKIAGSVESAVDGQPLASAFLIATTAGEPNVLSGGARANTDAMGQFELSLHPSAKSMDLIVGAPGHALTFATVPIVPGRPLVLKVGRDGGTLSVEFEPRALFDPRLPSLVLLHGTASTLLGDIVAKWSFPRGELPEPVELPKKVTLPDMAPGEYAVCALTLPELRTSQAGRGQWCASAIVRSGAETVVQVPRRSVTPSR